MPRFRAVIATAAGLGMLLLVLFTTPSALAQGELPLSVEGLRGGRHVGSAAPLSPAVRLAAGGGYAYTESVLDGSDRHHRALSEIAGGWAPRQYLQLSLGFQARYDGHRSDVTGEDSGAAFATELATRHALALRRDLWLAAQTRLRFPPAESVVRGLSAISPELGVLVTQRLRERYDLSLQLGYRFDRSREAVRDPERLSQADRLGASLSRFDAALLGALVSAPIGPVTASAEWSSELLAGSGKPPARTWPMRLRLSAQMLLAKHYVPGAELGISPSARASGAALARVEPRLWLGVSLGYIFDPPAPTRRQQPPRVRPVPAPHEPARVLELHVVDATGEPVAGARVSVGEAGDGDERVTDEDGRVLMTWRSERRPQVAISAEGFEPYEAVLPQPSEGVTITLARALPEGEIKGRVRSLRGGSPLRARVVVLPLGQTVDTDSEGSFALTVPPGTYTLEISAEGHEAQQRPAQVERHGVTILVVDLRRARK